MGTPAHLRRDVSIIKPSLSIIILYLPNGGSDEVRTRKNPDCRSGALPNKLHPHFKFYQQKSSQPLSYELPFKLSSAAFRQRKLEAWLLYRLLSLLLSLFRLYTLLIPFHPCSKLLKIYPFFIFNIIIC